MDKSLSWGDAPYFYPENLRELFNIPILWDFRNANFGAPQAGILWLYLPTFMFGLLNYFLNLNHGILIRLIFFLPATIIALVGSYIFLGNFTKNSKARILGSSLYGFNTYFLMILDGGQIGVSLAYGLFPLVSHWLMSFLKKVSTKSFILSLSGLFILTNVDLRVAILVILFSVVIYFIVLEKKYNFKNITSRILVFGLPCLVVVLLDLFWIIPFLLNGGEFPGGRFTEVVKTNNLVTLLDSFYLYQSHFPINDFGKILPPPFYFGFLPFLLIIPNLFRKDSLKLLAIFLVFIFLAKGQNDPLGEIYGFLISNIPLGQAFRDSTKFYIPLMLISAILLALSFENISKFLQKSFNKNIFFLAIFAYILILIHPAVFGKLTGSLSISRENESFREIYHIISGDNIFYRTVWFPEAPPLAFTSLNHPAIYANRLYQERPFASMIDSDYDLFGFLNHKNFPDWVSLSGGQYLFFPENERKKLWTEKEKEERKIFTEFVSNLAGFKRLDWKINFIGLRNKLDPKPHIFGQKKSLLIVGGDDIYQKLLEYKNFDLGTQGFLFAESCMFDPKKLKDMDDDSLEIIYANKDKDDLAMTFLCNQMIDTNSAWINQWAYRSSNQYLRWKSELLEKGIRTYEYDLNKGISYSTVKDEKIVVNVKLSESEEYYLPIRYTNSTESAGLNIKLNDSNKDLVNKNSSAFSWEILGPFSLDAGNHKIEIINMGGLVVVNTLGLVRKSDFDLAYEATAELTHNFKSYDINEQLNELLSSLENNVVNVDYLALNPAEFKLKLPPQVRWIVFTDHYHKGWVLNNENIQHQSWPLYTMFNGFYIPQQTSFKNASILFKPQKIIPKSIVISVASLIFTSILLIFISRRKNE